MRFQTILAIDDPKILTFAATPEVLAEWGIGEHVGHPLDPDRWAEERQYERCDAGLSFGAFRRRRREVVTLLDRSRRINGVVAASICCAGGSRWTSGWRASPPTTTTTSIRCAGPSTAGPDGESGPSLTLPSPPRRGRGTIPPSPSRRERVGVSGPIQRCHAHDGRDLLAVQLPPLEHVDEHVCASTCTIPGTVTENGSARATLGCAAAAPSASARPGAAAAATRRGAPG